MAIKAALKKSVRIHQLANSPTVTVGTQNHFAQLPASWAGVNTARLLELFDGKTSESAIAACAGVQSAHVLDLIRELQRHDLIDLQRTPISYLERYNPVSGKIEKILDTERFPSDYAIQTFLNRLEVECDAATFGAGDTDGGRSAVLNRQEFSILIFGRGRIVNSLVGMLSASGFSKLHVIHRMRPRHADLKISETDMSGGFIRMKHIGQTRRSALLDLKEESSLFNCEKVIIDNPDLIISVGIPAPDALQRWSSEGTPYLLIETFSSAEVRVGPLVIPGQTPCARCVELTEKIVFAHEIIDTKTSFTEVGVALGYAVASSVVADVSQISTAGKSVFLATSITYSMRNFHKPEQTKWSSHPGCGCSWS